LKIRRSKWEGNQWPSVDLDVSENGYADFLIVLTHICAAFSVEFPQVTETLDGYIADLVIIGEPVAFLLDNWTFSLATPTAALREKIFDALNALIAETTQQHNEPNSVQAE
jgi:hypothetical protein